MKDVENISVNGITLRDYRIHNDKVSKGITLDGDVMWVFKNPDNTLSMGDTLDEAVGYDGYIPPEIKPLEWKSYDSNRRFEAKTQICNIVIELVKMNMALIGMFIGTAKGRIAPLPIARKPKEKPRKCTRKI